MSYEPRTGLGSTIGDAASAVVNVASDPCLGEVAKLTGDLYRYARSSASSSSGGSGGTSPAPAVPVKGIGLCTAVPPLRMAIYVAKNPWIVPVGAVGIIGTLLGIGYLLGRGGRK